MRWTRSRVNTMKLTEWRRELIPRVRWPWRIRLIWNSSWWFVMRNIQMVELGWQQMRSEFSTRRKERRGNRFVTWHHRHENHHRQQQLQPSQVCAVTYGEWLRHGVQLQLSLQSVLIQQLTDWLTGWLARSLYIGTYTLQYMQLREL